MAAYSACSSQMVSVCVMVVVCESGRGWCVFPVSYMLPAFGTFATGGFVIACAPGTDRTHLVVPTLDILTQFEYTASWADDCFSHSSPSFCAHFVDVW